MRVAYSSALSPGSSASSGVCWATAGSDMAAHITSPITGFAKLFIVNHPSTAFSPPYTFGANCKPSRRLQIGRAKIIQSHNNHDHDPHTHHTCRHTHSGACLSDQFEPRPGR